MKKMKHNVPSMDVIIYSKFGHLLISAYISSYPLPCPLVRRCNCKPRSRDFHHLQVAVQ